MLTGIYGTHALGESLNLDFGGCLIEVRSNSHQLVDILADYYANFLNKGSGGNADIIVHAIEGNPPEGGLKYTLKAPEPGKAKIKEEYVDFPDGRIVRKRLTGMVFMFGQQRNVAIGPCITNNNQVINFINSRYIQWQMRIGGLLSHAAGVVYKGRGMALAGMAGAGKSTLALHIMSRGTDFVSNDRLVLRRSGTKLMMYGLPKLPRINPGTALNNPHLKNVIPPEDRAKFAALPPDELWKLEHKYDADIDACFGKGRFRLSADMFSLVLLNWERNGGPAVFRKVNLNERPELMAAFMKSVGLFFDEEEMDETPDFSPDAYLRLLGHCPVLEISGGIDFGTAADTCVEFLRTGDLPEGSPFNDIPLRVFERGNEKWLL
ncbi:MAG: HprK-related kinase B [Nitrospinae bacterium]|nr:HprK-related kinase B [Nitrospinota bacterium]